ncbi:MAG: amidase family protein [Burkholderiaceae bacterium]
MHLARVSKLDERVGAVVIRDFEHARQTALQADNQINAGHAGPLAGLPMTVKESMNVARLPTTCGMEASRRFVSAHDGRNVERLRQAGAILFGKTNVPIELSDWQSDNPIYGRTSNPYDRSLTPVAARADRPRRWPPGSPSNWVAISPARSAYRRRFAVSTVTARPRTALAKSGQWPMAPAANPLALMGVQGPMARSAADLHLAMQVLAGPDIGEETAWHLQLPACRHERLNQFRVATMPIPESVIIDPSIRAALARITDGLQHLGVTVTQATPCRWTTGRSTSRCT